MRLGFERGIAGLLLLLLSPILTIIGCVIRIVLGRPVTYRQERLGLAGQPFQLIKFRSMTDDRDSSGELLSDRERLKPLGQFLRSTSLDELPELINVFLGQMAFVGPRPLPTRYRNRFTEREHRRLEVLPGLTGLAQVGGRNLLGWTERLELDVWYVENRSWKLDLRILLQTVFVVVSRRGIAEESGVTMSELPELGDRFPGRGQ